LNTKELLRVIVFPVVAVLAAVPTTALADGSAPGTSPSQSQASAEATYKATHDADPHVPIYNQVRASGAFAAVAASVPSDALMTENQQGQSNGYYCGPAAVAEANGEFTESTTSQTTTASQLRTNTNGTAWSGVNANIPSSWITGYPVRDVINYDFYLQYGSNPVYSVAAVPYTPTSTDVNNYKSRMTTDTSAANPPYWSGFPVVGDAWEVAGYPHLNGHPKNQTIFHWFTIIGYENYGTYTSYEDSATTLWTSVPKYTLSFSSSTLVGILGGRGYVW
jgi:hypothetical protein